MWILKKPVTKQIMEKKKGSRKIMVFAFTFEDQPKIITTTTFKYKEKSQEFCKVKYKLKMIRTIDLI